MLRFDTWSYELDRPFPKGKNERVIKLLKNEVSGKIMSRCFELIEWWKNKIVLHCTHKKGGICLSHCRRC